MLKELLRNVLMHIKKNLKMNKVVEEENDSRENYF